MTPLLLLALAAAMLTGCTRGAEAETAGRQDQPTSGLSRDEGSVDPTDAETTVHPLFSLSFEEFHTLVLELPDQYRDPALERPHEFLELLALVAAEPEELTWLVDKNHPLSPGYGPTDLVELDDAGSSVDVSRGGHRIRKIALVDLLLMVESARAEGITLLISSGYRSYEYQADVYQYWVDTLGQAEADRTSARPGTSQHQLGTVIDFGCICEEFGDTIAGRWMAENAWRFGFSMSYPDGYEEVTGYAHESWHFRFVGRSAALMEREFFGGVQQHFVEFMTGKSTVFLSHLIEI